MNAAALRWDAILKMIKVELEIIPDANDVHIYIYEYIYIYHIYIYIYYIISYTYIYNICIYMYVYIFFFFRKKYEKRSYLHFQKI